MSQSPLANDLLSQIRAGDDAAWRELIETYEGRLRAFARSRLNDAALAEDVVQEAFIGFLRSLPNYDETATPVESFLFRITAYKITDVLRQQGRRGGRTGGLDSSFSLAGPDRKASSLARSQERRDNEESRLSATLTDLLTQWKMNGDWERIKTCELLFVRGLGNKEVAHQLGLTEQQVANHKQALTIRLKRHLPPETPES